MERVEKTLTGRSSAQMNAPVCKTSTVLSSSPSSRLRSRGLARETLPARTVWDKVVESQIETGTPYMLYKDAANEKSNQKNLGTIRSSNLCTEIMEYTAKDEVAVCNLASIALPSLST